MTEQTCIDLTPNQLSQVRELLQRYLPNTKAWAYGSRVRWSARPDSDLDVVVFSGLKQQSRVSELREAFEESSLPFLVDLFVWDQVPSQFHKNITGEYFELQSEQAQCNQFIKNRDVENEWPLVKIEDIQADQKAAIAIGPFGSRMKSDCYVPEGIPVIRGTNLDQGPAFKGDFVYITEEMANALGGCNVYKDDLVFPHRGSIGEVGIVSDDNRYVISSSLMKLTVDRQRVNPKYLYYFFKSIQGRHELLKNASQVGTPGIGQPLSSLKSIEFRNPPLKIQDKITEHISAINDKIHLHRQTNQTLEALAQALFKSWFVDFDPVIDNALAAGNPIPPALESRATARAAVQAAAPNAPLAESYHHLFPSEFEHTGQNVGIAGWVPKGWSASNVGNCFDVTMGQSPPGSTYNESGEGLPFFQGKTDFGFRYPKNRIYCTEPKRLANKSDTLISVRAPVGDVNMAGEKCILGRGVAAARHRSGAISFTYYSMKQLEEYFKVFESEGTVFGSINQKDFKSLELIDPSSKVISFFEKISQGFDEKIENNSNDLNLLEKLRDTLLPKLISGELRIPDTTHTIK